MNKENILSSVHITRGSIMASDVRREANEDRLKRIRERDRNQGRRESLRDPGQNVCSYTALMEYLTVLLKYIDLLGPISIVGPRAKCPSCPPPLLAALIEIKECNLFI